jgi:hypothetical protein
MKNPRDFLLRPLQITLRLLRGSHAIGKIAPCFREKFAVFGIEFAGP